MSNGKGDTPRPLSVPKHMFDAAWARTFGGVGKSAMVERSAVAYARDVLGADVTEWQAEIDAREVVGGFNDIPGAGQGGREPEPGEVATVYPMKNGSEVVFVGSDEGPMCGADYDEQCVRCYEDNSGAGGI